MACQGLCVVPCLGYQHPAECSWERWDWDPSAGIGHLGPCTWQRVEWEGLAVGFALSINGGVCFMEMAFSLPLVCPQDLEAPKEREACGWLSDWE